MKAALFLLLFSSVSGAQASDKSASSSTSPDTTTEAPSTTGAETSTKSNSPSSSNNDVQKPTLVPPPPGPENPDFATIELDLLRPTNRDPFSKPKSLLEKEVETQKPTIDPSVYVDTRIEAIRRFPLRFYTLVGIIFDVENPKAMVKDQENNMHLLTLNQRIGNQEGLIVKIERGELVVEEKGKLVTLKLHK